jgi:precorrin-6A/cobalt-precorrin-6A reductase
MSLLILGGTTEAARLAERVAAAGIPATISLAGRTLEPARQALPTRIGGFGGVDGLKAWLTESRTRAVIDATHPFAAQIAANAAAATATLGVPLCRLTRAAWKPVADDRWIEVADAGAAALAIGVERRRVFLTAGRLELVAFAAAPQHHYLVRTIDPPGQPLPSMQVILDRGPFDAAAEERLMREHAIDCLVTKNSGGKATAGKLAAARSLGLAVIMIRRPQKPAVTTFHAIDDAMAWVRAHLGS